MDSPKVVELDGAREAGSVACPCGTKFVRPLIASEADPEAHLRRAVAQHLVESHAISTVKAPFLAALIVEGKAIPEHDLAAIVPARPAETTEEVDVVRVAFSRDEVVHKSRVEVVPAAPVSATAPRRADVPTSACKHCARLPEGEKCARHGGRSHSTSYAKTGQRKGPRSTDSRIVVAEIDASKVRDAGSLDEVDLAVNQAKRALDLVIVNLEKRLQKAKTARVSLDVGA
jgi:hypothetical protein